MTARWLIVMLLGLMAAPLPVFAANNGSNLPPGALFRYQDKHGDTVISSSLSEEALYAGYQVLDSNGQVVETVAPGIPESQRAAVKAQREQAIQDQQMLRMYTDPDGALRTRNRQIETIQLKMSYAKNDLSRQKASLNEQIGRAASYQKQGKPVPQDVQDLITLYSGQVSSTEGNIAQSQADIQAINKQYDAIIQRLEKLTGKKVTLEDNQAGLPVNKK